MNETDTRIRVTETQIPEAQREADEHDARYRETDPARTALTGSFAEGEETLPERDAEERALDPGSFASGVEEMPDANADRRLHARGGFAVGEEAAPEADAEARRRPGTFADTEPQYADTESTDRDSEPPYPVIEPER